MAASARPTYLRCGGDTGGRPRVRRAAIASARSRRTRHDHARGGDRPALRHRAVARDRGLRRRTRACGARSRVRFAAHRGRRRGDRTVRVPTRDDARDRLCRTRRRSGGQLHRRIGGALERSSLLHSDALPELAHHYGLAGDAERARRFNELAGDRAASVHAIADARTYYQRAQSLLHRKSVAFARIARKLNALSSSP